MENTQNFNVVEGQFDSPAGSQSAINKVTSFEDLQRYSRGTVVQLPPFAEGQPFVAMMRRPSLLALAKIGKIPNALLTSANELFNNGKADTDNESMLSDLCEICDVICEASLIEPTFEQIVNAGLEITDEQKMAIFNYTQVGSQALASFRQE